MNIAKQMRKVSNVMKRFSIRTILEVVAVIAVAIVLVQERSRNLIPRPRYNPGELVTDVNVVPMRIVRATYSDYGGVSNETWLYECRIVDYAVPGGGIVKGLPLTPIYRGESELH